MAAFLAGRIAWAAIAEVVADTLDRVRRRPAPADRTVDDVARGRRRRPRAGRAVVVGSGSRRRERQLDTRRPVSPAAPTPAGPWRGPRRRASRRGAWPLSSVVAVVAIVALAVVTGSRRTC